jgi:hypothetical protein
MQQALNVEGGVDGNDGGLQADGTTQIQRRNITVVSVPLEEVGTCDSLPCFFFFPHIFICVCHA